MTMRYEINSWVKTFIADLAIDLLAGLLTGLATLSETGDYTTATIMAIVVATSRSVLKVSLNKGAKKLKELKHNQ